MRISTSSGSQRTAFSLVELLVVLLILGVSLALLMPAVQAAREAARRFQCASRLRQLGIANQSYHDAFGSFPAMRLGTRRGVAGSEEARANSNEFCMSGLVSLLPMLEQQPVFRQASAVNFGPVPWRTSAHWRVQIAGLLCPSDSVYDQATTAQASYKFCVGTTVRNNHSIWGEPNNGMYTVIGEPRATRTTVRIRDIRDGMSHTVAMSERRNGNRRQWFDVANAARKIEAADSNEPAVAYDACWATAAHHEGRRYDDGVSIREGPRPGERWADGRPYYAGFTTIVPPNGPSCLVGSTDVGHGVFTASSRHPEYVNVLMADGSVAQVADSIDRNTWWAMGTRDGRETMGQF